MMATNVKDPGGSHLSWGSGVFVGSRRIACIESKKKLSVNVNPLFLGFFLHSSYALNLVPFKIEQLLDGHSWCSLYKHSYSPRKPYSYKV